MPTKDYQLVTARNAVHKLTRWSRQLGILKKSAIDSGNPNVAANCETAVKGLNGVINYFNNRINTLEEELLMADVSIKVEKPERHLKLVKK